MILVGLAGRIGSGKSTVARLFAERGATVIDADRFAHDVLETPQAREAVAAAFGPDVLDGQGRVVRRALAERVFGPDDAHAANLATLEAIVHPPVRRRIEQKIDELAASPTSSRVRAGNDRFDSRNVAVLDVPLLMQTGWAERCDWVVQVACDEAVRLARLADRGWSAAEQAWRDAAWMRHMPTAIARDVRAERAKTASVDTSGEIAYTRSQVERVWSMIIASASQ